MASPLLTKPTMPAVNDSNHGAPTGSPEPTRMPTARTKASFFSPPSFMFLVSHPTGSPELKRMQTALTKAKKSLPHPQNSAQPHARPALGALLYLLYLSDVHFTTEIIERLRTGAYQWRKHSRLQVCGGQ